MAITVLLAMLLPFLPAQPAAAQGGFAMPYGFIQDQVVVGLDRPTSFALAPDGRIYIAEKSGKMRVAVNGELLPEPFIDLSYEVNDSADRGLLGIALHPNFSASPYIYLSYTYDPPEIKDRNPSGARVSRVLRLTADPANLNVAQAGSGVVILGTNSTADHVGNPDQGDTEPFSCFDEGGAFVRDCIANEGTAHSLDYLQFGPEGALYVAAGDGIVNSKGNSRALDFNSLNGKILRIDPDTGEGLPDNPFFDGDPGSNRSKVFAMGLRNPFRFTVDPRNGKLIIGEVGNSNWEEINVGGAGANFGWPCYEGPNEAATYANCDAFKNGDAVMTPGVYSYPHSLKNPQRGSAIGGDLYLGKAFPALYRGAYFFQDFNGGIVDFLTFNADGTADHHEFGTNMPGIVQMTTGDDGALYMLSVILNGLWRVRYAPGGNKPPTAVATADVQGGAAPLEVTFSSKRSTDPENSLVGYAWDFGDGETSSKANPIHTFAEDGIYDVALTVTDSAGDTSSTSIQIAVGAAPPVAEILEPGDGAKYRIGQKVVLKGKGTDPDDGELSGDALQWSVLLHHDKHVHYDAFNGSGAETSFAYDDHGDNTWYEVCLTATDSQGLEDTDCVEIKAEEVTYTFNTVPAGLSITYAGSRYKTPFKVNTYIDAKRIIEAPLTAGDGLAFEEWSDGGDAVHEIVIQETAQTFTATYGDGSGAPVADDAAAADLANAEVVTPTEDAHTDGDGHTHAEDEAAPMPTGAAPASAAPGADTCRPCDCPALERSERRNPGGIPEE
ncbi:MAG: PQQ-dependent sugar dehydrogenase [Anaerolineales bacterium]|nr:PQQ-dependent sugar dehydrogenase [Anaerolineales bacterium]